MKSVLIKLPVIWIVWLNAGGWLCLQLGLAWLFLRLPAHWFNWRNARMNRANRQLYERFLLIKRWKDWLPDGARWFSHGFSKRALANKHPEYLRRFVCETRRGEICHWLAIACVPLFGLWNPGWGLLVNAAYALLANLPCILVQRYNRARLLRLNRMLHL